MRLFPVTAVFVLATACAAPPPAPPAASPAAAPFPGGTLVDLSHTYDRTTVFWPTADTFRLDVVADGDTPAGYYYAANNFFSSEHGGTHLDAPVHFARGAQTRRSGAARSPVRRGLRRRRDRRGDRRTPTTR